jgi:hypothetical protein
MARTKGSGWGGGVILYQICPLCGKKKAMYIGSDLGHPFKCTWCKEHFTSDKLKRVTFKEHYDRLDNG